MSENEQVLTDPAFIRKLEMLSMLTRKVLGGNLKADRKSSKKGAGINFADYTEYNYGDDYRNIDWNIYARLESLVIKLFELEEDVRIFLFLDISNSMATKLFYAKKLTAALAYIALNNMDRLTIYGIADGLRPLLIPCHGRNKIFPMLEVLQQAGVSGRDTDLNECIQTFQLRHQQPGVCVVISDFFVPGGYRQALDLLRWSKHDVFCLQVLDPAELRCEWRGDVDFECVETGRCRQVTISPVEAAKFANAMQDWNDDLRTECARKGIGYVQTSIAIPFEDIIQNILRRGGLVA